MELSREQLEAITEGVGALHSAGQPESVRVLEALLDGYVCPTCGSLDREGGTIGVGPVDGDGNRDSTDCPDGWHSPDALLEREPAGALEQARRFARLAEDRFKIKPTLPKDREEARDHQAQAQVLALVAIAERLEPRTSLAVEPRTTLDGEADCPACGQSVPDAVREAILGGMKVEPDAEPHEHRSTT